MKRIHSLCVLLLAVMLIPDVAFAQCPGDHSIIQGGLWAQARKAPPTATAFIGTQGCPYVKVGAYPPSACLLALNTMSHRFIAAWPDSAQRIMGGTTAGCSFMCLNGVGSMGTVGPTCFVRAIDGLPIELMEFSVE